MGAIRRMHGFSELLSAVKNYLHPDTSATRRWHHFLSLNNPTREMLKEAASAGFYEPGGLKMPRIQILTATDILDNRRPKVPFGFAEGFKKAAKEKLQGQDRLL